MSATGKRVALWATLAAVLVAAWYAPADEEAESTVSGAVSGTVSAPARGSAGRVLPAAAPVEEVLKIRPREDEAGRDGTLFASTDWSPGEAVPAAQPAAVAEPAAAAPPLPFRVIGSFEKAGKTIVFLQQNERNHAVGVGDVIDETYRVEELEGSRLMLRYLPLDQVQVLELGRTFQEEK